LTKRRFKLTKTFFIYLENYIKMKFRLLFLFLGLMIFSNCSLDDNPIFKGAFSIINETTSMVISCEGVVMTIMQEGRAFQKMKDQYLAENMSGQPVLVTIKAKVIKAEKLKNGKEIQDIEVTSLLEMEVGKTCTGNSINE